MDDPWTNIFANEAAKKEEAHMNDIEPEESGEQLDPEQADLLASDGSDYEPENSRESEEDEEDDEEHSEDLSSDSGDDSESDEEVGLALHRSSRRQGHRIDYSKLNEELFGIGEAYEVTFFCCCDVEKQR